MDRDTFENLMYKAKSFKKVGKHPEYWTGYMHGLRRGFHGEEFGTSHEHHLWMTACENEIQKLRSRGYRDGFDCSIQASADCET
jgi:hypothetical protein